MSSNFFAALGDSDEETPAKPTVKDIKKAAPSKTVEASVVDQRRRPNQHDRNTKHGRGGRAPPRDGKRQYDRRSGTGRGKEIKKDGGGARNWGSDKNEAKSMEGIINEEDVVVDEEEKPEEVVEAIDEQPDPPREPEPDNTMTFSEYMASKEKKVEYVGRSVENDFKGVSMAMQKEADNFLVMGGGKQKKIKKKKEEKKIVDVGFRVANPNSGRGGRGFSRDARGDGRGGPDGGGRGGREGRGRGGRDGRGRGVRGGRGPKGEGYNRAPGLNVQDENAFPSL